ncbi:undecaprenyl-diphosphate phosphatase [Stackebrandtia nassauensis]|uniref:Undecaprenyl-diphosphatase n=1 Tax=Stackebrandtia nassauensis (strain DSM 44728 / CIP 108903 / NRRL B-16338 / NBRC 102104 / LLR-40K-21) TaxID=446470 RepID=D3Q599_STANL|nr:undecaprenyl-diphosphate phosphatase [Stackebrandtia nassauensis]ADD44148.1 undecaprenol kinase [Stackebrandtia nassauensis DSM 44728]
MELWQAVVLGIVEGLTEFLPVSSTGHLTIAEGLMGLKVNDPAITAYSVVIQSGAIAAVLVYFFKDIVRITAAFFRGLFNARARQDFDYKFGWYIIAGSIPIVIVGVLGKDIIKGPLRSLWVVAIALILWSGVMWFAEYAATHQRSEKQLKLKDTVIIGLAQCVALIPGVSRSGATISAGLLRDLDRVTATRLSFFLGIPALVGGGIYEFDEVFKSDIGVAPIVVGTVVSFGVAYASVAWLLKFVAGHSIAVFVWYRIGLGVLIMILLGTGAISSTGAA